MNYCAHKKKNINFKVTTEGRISGYFFSDKLSHRVLTETEIKVLDKGLHYARIQKKINEPELRKDFSEFCLRMRNKRNLWNEATPEAAIRGVLCKKVFFEISQNSQENTCARVSFLIKLQA